MSYSVFQRGATLREIEPGALHSDDVFPALWDSAYDEALPHPPCNNKDTERTVGDAAVQSDEGSLRTHALAHSQ